MRFYLIEEKIGHKKKLFVWQHNSQLKHLMSRWYVSPEKEIRMPLRLSKVPNSQSTLVCIIQYYNIQCVRPARYTQKKQAFYSHSFLWYSFPVSIYFYRLLSSKMWFFILGTWAGGIFQPFEQKLFQWLNLFSIFQFF